MLSVALTVCAIVALIWWLTGASRTETVPEDPEVEREVVTEALTRVAGESGVTSEKAASVGRVLYDLLVGVGMGSDEAAAAVKAFGYAPPEPRQDVEAAAGLTVFSLKEEAARAAVERALLVGVQLARMDDDYAGVSDETVAFEALRQRADEAEALLFDDRRRARLSFYARAVMVLQDRMQAEADPEHRAAIAEVLAKFDCILTGLQEEMAAAMADLPTDDETLAWGDSEDRRRYYFKMGVTNSLRRSGVLSSLGHLYRFRGVNYDVEEAFQLAGEEAPILLQAARLDFDTLVSLRPSDVRRLTDGRRVTQPFKQG